MNLKQKLALAHEIETKLRRVIAGIPLTKGLADGMKIRKQLRDIIFTIRSRDEPLNTQRIKNYQKQNGEIKMTLKNNKQGGEK